MVFSYTNKEIAWIFLIRPCWKKKKKFIQMIIRPSEWGIQLLYMSFS